MRVIQNKEYISYFNEKTGEYIRTGIIKNSVDTGKDPFMAEFPELIDVGIMGHCVHGKSGLCIESGVECYQNGLTSYIPNMKLDDFRQIASECKGRTFQFALGGCGDPDQHEDFEKILQICEENDIVPNFTTSGLGLTQDKALLCKKYCGAVAVSWYRSPYTLKAIKTLVDCGVKTNIHYVLTKNTIEEAINRLKATNTADGFPKGINAVIFLLHKPVGQGKLNNIIDINNASFNELCQIVDNNNLPFKLGFDSCTVPALLNLKNIDFTYLDTCEGGRWSAYISSDMRMMPCSFAHTDDTYSISLNELSIAKAWHSEKFDLFRNKFKTACPDCTKRDLCLGGCPIIPQIVLCKDKKY